LEPEKLEPLVDRLCRQIPSLLGAYLFGSAAHDQVHSESDVDIAILAERPQNPATLWDLAQTLTQMVGRDVDLIDLRRASAVLRMQVIGNGRRLFCNDPALCETFEDFVYSDYARLNEERAGILQDVARRKTPLRMR